jgi:hypothetical protein
MLPLDDDFGWKDFTAKVRAGAYVDTRTNSVTKGGTSVIETYQVVNEEAVVADMLRLLRVQTVFPQICAYKTVSEGRRRIAVCKFPDVERLLRSIRIIKGTTALSIY